MEGLVQSYLAESVNSSLAVTRAQEVITENRIDEIEFGIEGKELL